MRPYLAWKKQGLSEPIFVSHIDVLGCKIGPDLHLSEAGFRIGATGTLIEWSSVVGAYAGVDPKRNCGKLGWTLIIVVNFLLLACALGGGNATTFGFDNQQGVVIVLNKRRRWRFGHSKRVVASAIDSLPPPMSSPHDSSLAEGADYEFFGMGSVSELTITTAELIEIVNNAATGFAQARQSA